MKVRTPEEEERDWQALVAIGVATRDRVLAEWREEMARPWRPQDQGEANG